MARVLRRNQALEHDVLSTAAALSAQGVRPGDRVLLAAGNSVDYPVTLLALCHLDASVVLADPELPAHELASLGAQAGVRWQAGGALSGVPAVSGKASGAAHGQVCLAAWSARRDAAIMWSSGSTGGPKAVVKPGRAVLANCEVTARVTRYREDDVLAPLLPFSHQYGLSLLLIWWLARCGLLVVPYRRLDTALAEAAGLATVVDAAPPAYHSMLALFTRRPALLASLSGVRMWCVGGAPLPRPLAARWSEVTGHDLLDGYGLTEAGNVAVATLAEPSGCGRPLPGVRVAIRDERGADVPAGVIGEIVLGGPYLMAGYLGAGGRLRERAGTWLATGDLGYLDEAGRLCVLGRKRATHRMGHTLYPEYLERKAEECGAPVKVLAREDTRRGASLVFFVEDDSVGEREWRERFHRHLAPFEQPNAIFVIPRFPHNRNGKVDIPALLRIIETER